MPYSLIGGFFMLNLLINILIIAILFILIIRLKKIEDFVKQYDIPIDEQLSSYELERIEREKVFDERITRLKDELALSNAIERKGSIAQELHPGVKNLPHTIIPNQKEPDEEFAD